MILTTLNAAKADDLVVIDLSGKGEIADYMVIVSGFSSRHVASMTNRLIRKLKTEGVSGITTEGARVGDWVLIDVGDILVHLFRPEVRRFYDLEKLWGVLPADTIEDLGLSSSLLKGQL